MFSELLIVIALIIHGVSFVHRSKYVTLKVWKSFTARSFVRTKHYTLSFHLKPTEWTNYRSIELQREGGWKNIPKQHNINEQNKCGNWRQRRHMTILIFLYPRHSIWKSNSLSDCHQYKQLPVDVIGYFWSTVMQIETV